MKNYRIYQLVLILTPFVFSFAFGLDIYIPIIPRMSQIFDTSPALIHLTLSLFLFTTGVGQLVIGPLSDQYGRKLLFYVASALFAVGSLGCAFALDIAWLIGCRVVTALGACGMLVTSFALVRDLFSSNESAKMYSFLNGAIGISPTFAPILGGYLAVYMGWQSIFFFLALLGVFSMFVTKWFIKETHEPAKRVRMDTAVFKRYWKIYSHRQFIIYSLIGGLAEAVFFCFFSVSPFIIIDVIGIPVQEFGFYFAVFGSVIAFGGFGSGKLIEKIGISFTISIGIGLMVMGGVSMLGWHYLASTSLIGFLMPMVLACMGAMFLIGGTASAALEPFGDIAGTASAALGSIEFGVSSIAGAILMLFPINSTVPYGYAIMIIAVLSSGLFFVADRQPAEQKAEG